jgi:hypothetical protein
LIREASLHSARPEILYFECIARAAPPVLGTPYMLSGPPVVKINRSPELSFAIAIFMLRTTPFAFSIH